MKSNLAVDVYGLSHSESPPRPKLLRTGQTFGDQMSPGRTRSTERDSRCDAFSAAIDAAGQSNRAVGRHMGISETLVRQKRKRWQAVSVEDEARMGPRLLAAFEVELARRGLR